MTSLLDITIEELKNGTLKIVSEDVIYPITKKKKAFTQTINFTIHKDGTKSRINKKIKLQMMEILLQ